MIVEYELEDPIFTVGSVEDLESEVREFLSTKKLEFPIECDGSRVVVRFPDDADIDADEDERIVLGFCRDHRFGKARKVAHEFLEKRPWDSEGYRLLAQIEMEKGEVDAAVEHAKDAVRLNPRNLYALTLLGNLLSRDKHCIDDGMRFTRRAYQLFPDSAMAVNNYAGTLMQMKDVNRDELDNLFRVAIDLDPTYMNPYYGLAQGYMERGDVNGVFETVMMGLKRGTDRPENTTRLRELMTEIVVRSARELSKNNDGSLVEIVRKNVEQVAGIQIRIEEDASLSCPAKMEMADRYHRAWHRLVVNPSKVKGARPYYVAHELEKLLMHFESANAGRGAKFAANHESYQAFLEKTLYLVTDRFRKSIPAGNMEKVIRMLMDGVGGQLMNCPLDMFVSRRLYEHYPQLRPFHVTAAVELTEGAVGSVRTGVMGGFPKNIVRINRILNAVTFLANKDVLGIDFLPHLEIPEDELKVARKLYGIFNKTAERFSPGDEWDVVSAFINELRCGEYFQIITTSEEREEKQRQEESTRTFQENFSSGKNPGVNMAVMIHMVEAISRLRSIPLDEVRNVAAEIAMIGTQGISPDRKSGYIVRSLGGEDMSGCRLLAYYYVAWKIAFPEKVSFLGLPFEKEYEQALGLGKAGM